MQRFKSTILKMQGKSKTELHWLYNDRFAERAEDAEKEKTYSYRSLRFRFAGTGHRNAERLLLYVEIPTTVLTDTDGTDILPLETYLLHVFSPLCKQLSDDYANTDKNRREKASFAAQPINHKILRRNGIYHDRQAHAFVLEIHFQVPLVNALSINAKATFRALKELLDRIEDAIHSLDQEKATAYKQVYRNQQFLRAYIKQQKLCAFIAEGSILPRENGTEQPMKNAIPFRSPEELRETICLPDGTELTGMAIRQGVTVITGGGYSGKSTLLDAIEQGIYDHIPGDGREYVITDRSALKIDAEDGRPVHQLNLTPFFRFLPTQNEGIFSTLHASGSVSQAANIVESICNGSKLLLIDEDKSATNFMIRDDRMRKIVPNDPIIPFTDRVRELVLSKGVSTVLVIGGSSEYLGYADRVLLMDDYRAKDMTASVKALKLPPQSEIPPAQWTEHRFLALKKSSQPFLYFRTVEIENQKNIFLDNYSADITHLTAIVSKEQMQSLALIMEQLLTDKDAGTEELTEKVQKIHEKLFSIEPFKHHSLLPDAAWNWYEELRPLDTLCCVNRMHGLQFSASPCVQPE